MRRCVSTCIIGRFGFVLTGIHDDRRRKKTWIHSYKNEAKLNLEGNARIVAQHGHSSDVLQRFSRTAKNKAIPRRQMCCTTLSTGIPEMTKRYLKVHNPDSIHHLKQDGTSWEFGLSGKWTIDILAGGRPRQKTKLLRRVRAFNATHQPGAKPPQPQTT